MYEDSKVPVPWSSTGSLEHDAFLRQPLFSCARLAGLASSSKSEWHRFPAQQRTGSQLTVIEAGELFSCRCSAEPKQFAQFP